METLPALLCMYQLGQAFIEDEDQPEDASDREAMQRILDELEALVEAEAAEPDEVETASRREDTVNARELSRLRREADGAVKVAHERLYRRAAQ